MEAFTTFHDFTSPSELRLRQRDHWGVTGGSSCKLCDSVRQTPFDASTQNHI